MDKCGQGEGGGFSVSEHPFSAVSFQRGEGIYESFYHHLPPLKIET